MDSWVVDIRLKRIPVLDAKGVYPRCTAGRRASPPEDRGGYWVYLSVLDRHGARRWEVIERLTEALEPFVVTGEYLALDDHRLLEALDDLEERNSGHARPSDPPRSGR